MSRLLFSRIRADVESLATDAATLDFEPQVEEYISRFPYQETYVEEG